MKIKLDNWIYALRFVILILFVIIPIPDPKISLLNGIIFLLLMFESFYGIGTQEIFLLIIGVLGLIFLFNKRYFLAIIGLIFLNYWLIALIEYKDFSRLMIFALIYVIFVLISFTLITLLLLRKKIESKKQ